MFDRTLHRGKARFSLKPLTGAHHASIAGDFSKWTPKEMQRQRDGSFFAIVPAKPGLHEYKFVVDGRWILDPDNAEWVLSPLGTMNSVAHV